MEERFQTPEMCYIPLRPKDQRATSNVRSRRVTFIVLATVLYGLALVISIRDRVAQDHWWGIAVHPVGIHQIWSVTWVDSGLGSDYQLIVGDQILQTDGQLPQSSDQINRANTLEVRDSKSDHIRTISWQPPNALENALSASWLVLGGASLFLGLLVFLHATERALAVRFFLLWTGLAIVASLEVATTFGDLLAVHVAAGLSTGLLPLLLANCLWWLLFPSSRTMSLWPQFSTSKGKRPHARAGYRVFPDIFVIAGVLTAVLYVVAVTLQRQDLYDLVRGPLYIEGAVGICLSLFFILWKGLTRRSTLARERARTLLGGVIVGTMPLLVLTLLPALISGSPLVPGIISALALIALPLAFAYAILRRELLRLDSLIRNTTLILLTVLGLAIIAVLLGAVLELLPTPPALVIGISAGAVLAPFILAGARWITEAWLFPQVRVYRRLVAQGETIERTGLDPHRIVGQLIGEVHLALPVRQVAVFAPDKQTGHLIEVAVSQAGGYYGGHVNTPLSSGAVRLASPLLSVPQEPSVLYIDEALSMKFSIEGVSMLVEAVPTIRRASDAPDANTFQHFPSSPMDESSAATLEQPSLENWHLLVPMRVRGRLVAILALTRREDEQTYSDTDLRVIRFLAGRRTLALDYALLYADLHMAYERRQEVDRLKDQFIVTAHHELRTPLTGVQGYLELLRELGPEGRTSRPQDVDLFIERACHATDELNEQLETLLSAAEVTITANHLKKQPVAISRVAQRAISTLEALAHQGQHRVTNKVPLELFALGDEEALYRIFLNLLSNALKYSPGGRPVLLEGHIVVLPASVLARTESESANDLTPPLNVAMVEILVRDWGVGIEPQDHVKIFERFTRLERDLNSPIRGSGLGLSITRELVQAMGGQIWVKSKGPNTGSTFFVRLPIPA